MKKLLILCVLTSILVLMAGHVVADPNLCFDFDGDEECDTSWDISGTKTVEIYLDDWDTSPWPTEPLWAVQIFFYYDHTKIDLNIGNSFPNDTIHGGPFDSSLSLSQQKGDGKYKLTASNNVQNCTVITDRILLWTLELEDIASGMSDIYIRIDFSGDPDHGAIFPGGADCLYDIHQEDGGDGHATINAIPGDGDGDGVPDVDDNCPNHPNGPDRGICTEFIGDNFIVSNGQYCTADTDCDDGEYCEKEQADNYPPQGNGIGDACDCEGNFDCDDGVTAADVGYFLVEWNQRTIYGAPCTNQIPCYADFNCS